MALIMVALITRLALTAKPNIVHVMLDDVGQDNYGFLNGVTKSPAIDSLREEGLLLTNFYVHKWCSPTRASLMTGRQALHHGLDLQPYPLPEQYIGVNKSYVFLPELLKTAGYHTAMLGKWHLGWFEQRYTPCGRGFDTYFGYLSGDENYTSHFKWPMYRGEGFPQLPYITDLFNNTGPAFGNPYNGTYSTFMYANEMEKILANASKNDSPLYLYIALQSTHSPYMYVDEYFDKYPNLAADGMQRRMHSMISAADDVVGKLIAGLKVTYNLWNNTIVILHSDNGAPEASSPGHPATQTNCGGSAYPYRGQKFTTWEGGTHTPAIISGGWLPQTCIGKMADGIIHVTDWYRTFAQLAGVSEDVMQKADSSGPYPIDGFTALNHIQSCGATPATRNETLYHYASDTDGALRVGDWKMLMGTQSWPKYCWTPNYTNPQSDGQCITPKGQPNPCPPGKPCLFNLRIDPYEHNNIASENPDVVKQLMTRFLEWGKTSCSKSHPNSKCLDSATPEQVTMINQLAEEKLFLTPLSNS
eukprot:m.3967 g.3967  ORF g.3967 m.3967 type:complete len:530 (-) comp2857_c0_seq1:230-1819(-)